MRRSGRIVGQSLLEVAEIFRDATGEERLGSRAGFGLLVLVVEVGRDRMVRVVDLGDEVRDRQLQAVGVEAERLVLRREAELRAEIGEEVGDVRDDTRPSRRKGGAKGANGLSPISRSSP